MDACECIQTRQSQPTAGTRYQPAAAAAAAAKSLQSCPTLYDPMDCSLPGSSAHGIFQARTLEWGAIAFSTGPNTSWQIDGENVEAVTDFIFLGSKITVYSDCIHEIKGCLFLGRKAVTNPDSVLKNRDFTFTFHFHALEKEMVIHSSVLAWRIPGTREPGGLPSMGSCRVGHD